MLPGVVECRGMPVGEPGIKDCIEPLGIIRVSDIKKDAIAGTGSRCQILLGEHGYVMALIGDLGFLRIVTMISAFP